jgi:thiol:disulfide interchange protein DsbD
VQKKQIILGIAIVTTAVLVAGGALFFAWQKVPAAPASGESSKSAWHRHEDEALAEALDRKVPILVDFYADWCEPCVQMEQQVFSTDDFKKKSKEWVLFRVDATNDAPEIATLLAKYEVAGLPSLRFRRPDGSALPQFDVDGGLEFPQLSALMDEAREAALR